MNVYSWAPSSIIPRTRIASFIIPRDSRSTRPSFLAMRRRAGEIILGTSSCANRSIGRSIILPWKPDRWNRWVPFRVMSMLITLSVNRTHSLDWSVIRCIPCNHVESLWMVHHSSRLTKDVRFTNTNWLWNGDKHLDKNHLRMSLWHSSLFWSRKSGKLSGVQPVSRRVCGVHGIYPINDMQLKNVEVNHPLLYMDKMFPRHHSPCWPRLVKFIPIFIQKLISSTILLFLCCSKLHLVFADC